MTVKLIEAIKKDTGLTDYGIAKQLNRRGYEITIPAITHYHRGNCKGMKLEILVGLSEIWAELTDKPQNQFFNIVAKEFSKKK